MKIKITTASFGLSIGDIVYAEEYLTGYKITVGSMEKFIPFEQAEEVVDDD
jgi:hypothetical protein